VDRQKRYTIPPSPLTLGWFGSCGASVRPLAILWRCRGTAGRVDDGRVALFRRDPGLQRGGVASPGGGEGGSASRASRGDRGGRWFDRRHRRGDRAGAARPADRVAEAGGNRGKGAAVRAGIARATSRVVVLHDADLESDPASLLGLVEPIERGLADTVYGSRFLGAAGQATGPIRRIANWLLTRLSNRFTGLRLTDMETGQKTFRRELIQGLVLTEERFGIEPEITAKLARAGCRILEIPVRYTGRSRAAGKNIGVRDGLWTIACIAVSVAFAPTR